MELLLRAGADPLAGSPSALETARFFGRVEVARLLEQHIEQRRPAEQAGPPQVVGRRLPAPSAGMPADGAMNRGDERQLTTVQRVNPRPAVGSGVAQCGELGGAEEPRGRSSDSGFISARPV
jgi:hypothetical protein